MTTSAPCLQDTSLTTALGNRLRTIRMLRGLQQAELADRAQVSRNTVITLERTGQGTVSSMVRVAQALGLTAELGTLFQEDAALATETVQQRRRIRRAGRPATS